MFRHSLAEDVDSLHCGTQGRQDLLPGSLFMPGVCPAEARQPRSWYGSEHALCAGFLVYRPGPRALPSFISSRGFQNVELGEQMARADEFTRSSSGPPAAAGWVDMQTVTVCH